MKNGKLAGMHGTPGSFHDDDQKFDQLFAIGADGLITWTIDPLRHCLPSIGTTEEFSTMAW
jgi:hypothetical protein